ncbi:MAG: hypothetical protein H6600_02960 [Flavobacteriales bacterium]|nr:hypothetical protein [Flavobacteriales bacterium]
MNKLTLALTILITLGVSSCNKQECHECHYDDSNGTEVELGEYCNEDLEELESKGYSDANGDNHEVHCHEH